MMNFQIIHHTININRFKQPFCDTCYENYLQKEFKKRDFLKE